MNVDDSIMGLSVESSSSKVVSFHRASPSGDVVACGGSFTPGEVLFASLSDGSSGMHLFELSGGATFTSGSAICDNTRIDSSVASTELAMPSDPEDGAEVTLKVGWATSDDTKVKISTCKLRYVTGSPSVAPTAAPTGAPTDAILSNGSQPGAKLAVAALTSAIAVTILMV